jgi:hypothetical protein
VSGADRLGEFDEDEPPPGKDSTAVTVRKYLLSEWQRRESQNRLDLDEALLYLEQHKSDGLALAIQLGWYTYVKNRLTPARVQRKKGRSLLDYALRPSL